MVLLSRDVIGREVARSSAMGIDLGENSSFEVVRTAISFGLL